MAKEKKNKKEKKSKKEKKNIEKKRDFVKQLKIAYRGLENPKKFYLKILLPLIVIGVIIFIMPFLLNILLPVQVSFNPMTFIVGGIVPIFLGIFLFLFFYSIYIIFKSIKKVIGYKRKQLIYFLIASLIGIFTGSTAFFPVFNVPIFPFGMFIFPLYPIFLTYAIFRYQFLDIQIIIKRSTLYASLIILITALYFMIVFLFENIFTAVSIVHGK